MASFHETISEVGKVLGVPGFALDADGIGTLEVDELVNVTISYDEVTEAAVFHNELGEIAERDLPKVQSLLLEANVMWSGTGGATFGVVPASRKVILAYQELTCHLDSEAVIGLIVSFRSLAEFWMRAIQEEAFAGVVEESPDPDDQLTLRV
ncbi:type III secretion system chaperone [Thalassoglobus sp. JC818]|uniref:type III secretion system chaperone n=1 Tax=Thalassoglobus sp. JC818 TaxID=3232136 RepID=UPI0034595CCE